MTIRIVWILMLLLVPSMAHAQEVERCFISTDAKLLIEACTATISATTGKAGLENERVLIIAHERRGMAHAQLHHHDDAIKDLSFATKNGKEGLTETQIVLGAMYVFRRSNPDDIARGIVILSAVINRFAHVHAYSVRGLAFSEMGAFAVANEDHARAEELARGDAIVLNNRAMSCYLEFRQVPDKLTGCLEIARQAIMANVLEAGAHHTRGLINEALKHIADAKRDYSRALELSPTLATAAEALKRLETVRVPSSERTRRDTPSKPKEKAKAKTKEKKK